MRVLVTGGAGYIGSTTAAALLEKGHDVVVLDDLSRGHRDAVPDGAPLVRGDVGDPAAVREAIGDGVDACLHFAARIEAGESMRHPEAFFATNTGGSARLLQTLLDRGCTRVVLSSTAAVYGDPVDAPVREDHPVAPTNAYGASKLLVEQMLPWLADLRGLRFAVLRYFNAAGATPGRAERHDPETHLIPLALEVAAGHRSHLRIFGADYPTADGTAVRDYVHVADLADAHVRALQALTDHPRIVCNLGNGTGYSVRQVVSAARRVTGREVPTTDEPRRPGDPAVLVAASDRARSLLGWVPAHPDIDDIIASAWRQHPSGGTATAPPTRQEDVS